MTTKAVIIGAGLGGLATALRLQKRGFEVEIIEKNSKAGGRLNQLKKEGFTFDVGPSFFSMSYEFRELFEDIGEKMPFELEELDPIYGVNFAGSKKNYLIYKDLKKLADQFKEVEPDFERRAIKYLNRASAVFHDTEHVIVKKNYKNLADFLISLTRVPLKHGPLLFRSMWKELDQHFTSEEVKIIFSLVAFFLGSTPFDTPAVYSLLNYTELQHDGYWNVKGGMYKIVEGIKGMLEEKGVKFHFNTEITDVEKENGEIKAFIDKEGNRFSGDVFISNSDAAFFRGKVLKRKKFTEKKLDKMDWTLAPFTIYLGIKGSLDNLYHHNYFLGNNFKEYAETIFKTSVAPEKPYYYVNVSSKSNPNCAPEGHENLFILCPVPDQRYKPDWNDKNKLANDIIENLGERVGYNIKDNIVTQTIWDPIEWGNKFNLYKGSGLGLAHGMNQIGGFRPSNKDEEFANLYYVGASTVPGTGLPIVVISSKLVSERIMQDHEAVVS